MLSTKHTLGLLRGPVLPYQVGQSFKGFTLIEICVVLVIVAIITAMASLAFYRADSQRGMVALTTFGRSIMSMREQAILRQQSLGVYLTMMVIMLRKFILTKMVIS